MENLAKYRIKYSWKLQISTWNYSGPWRVWRNCASALRTPDRHLHLISEDRNLICFIKIWLDKIRISVPITPKWKCKENKFRILFKTNFRLSNLFLDSFRFPSFFSVVLLTLRQVEPSRFELSVMKCKVHWKLKLILIL